MNSIPDLTLRDTEDSLKMDVQRFLEENSFSKRKSNIALKRLKPVYDIVSTDSF